MQLSFTVDHTRVRLKDVDPTLPGADYINANYIKVSTLSDGDNATIISW